MYRVPLFTIRNSIGISLRMCCLDLNRVHCDPGKGVNWQYYGSTAFKYDIHIE